MSTGKESGNGNGSGGGGGGEPKDYLYDVFLSYSYRADVKEWVHKKFHPKFVSALDDEMIQLGQYVPPPKGRVCLANRELKPGDDWPQGIQNQLKGSRVMVAICSPPYFTISGWCRSEWATFRQRGAGVLIPVLFSGKDQFLKSHIDPLQGDDFRDFQHIPAARVHLFEQRIQALAAAVAAKVVAAPQFSAVAGLKPVVRRPLTVNVPLYKL